MFIDATPREMERLEGHLGARLTYRLGAHRAHRRPLRKGAEGSGACNRHVTVMELSWNWHGTVM